MRANDRLLRILGVLAERSRPLTLTELSGLVELPKSTALRFLRWLEPDGWVVRDTDDRYTLGPAVLALAGRYVSTDPILLAAAPLMAKLRDELGETISLSRVMGNARTCVQEFPSLESLRLVIGVGSIGPLHAGASGLLLLSHLDPRQRESVYAQGLPAFTKNTTTDPEELEAQCATIRKQRWAMTRGQKTLGGVAIAVPVRDRGAYASTSALGVYGPEARFVDRRDRRRWIDALTACAREIEDAARLRTSLSPEGGADPHLGTARGGPTEETA